MTGIVHQVSCPCMPEQKGIAKQGDSILGAIPLSNSSVDVTQVSVFPVEDIGQMKFVQPLVLAVQAPETILATTTNSEAVAQVVVLSSLAATVSSQLPALQEQSETAELVEIPADREESIVASSPYAAVVQPAENTEPVVDSAAASSPAIWIPAGNASSMEASAETTVEVSSSILDCKTTRSLQPGELTSSSAEPVENQQQVTTLQQPIQLQRALYGLKQAPCARFDRLRKYIFSNSFFYNLANPSLLFHIQLMVYLCC
ncbi:uncharacterized protein LOC110613809 isoform X3 [Manihot esculenta]|uniref:uncharacterized protein LOC110613809 isoform X3 n=2 Tax=Manihot esculenta TaxID=3983 RepID=UPI001CC5C22A|nr:uncharacterized protein LOC110613809 isoform X3 [Manihot esculenta]XP_043812066.1 uncharacterized protein LOC110613809 isoform X3 [Manihot esculenta]